MKVHGSMSIAGIGPDSSQYATHSFPIGQRSVTLKSNEVIDLFPASQRDVPETTQLIHQAYSYWTRQGVSLAPAVQTLDKTARHLVGKGFIARNRDQVIVSTFSLDNGRIEIQEDQTLLFFKSDNPPLSFSLYDDVSEILARCKKSLIFKKLAVSPAYARQGIGKKLYEIAESFAADHGYDSVILENVRETNWLYRWYCSLGFRSVGSHRYADCDYDTLLMVKPII